jgi:hypothetical protein
VNLANDTLLALAELPGIAGVKTIALEHAHVAAGQIYNCGDERQITARQWLEMIAAVRGHRWEFVSAADAVPHAGCLLAGFDTSHHRLLDIAKAQRDLGYADVPPVEQTLPRKLRWYLAHPLERGGVTDQRLADRFDYASEDRVAGALTRFLADLPRAVCQRPHAYAPSRAPGPAADHRRR